MQVFRTRCSTDWKGRPDHCLDLLGVVDDMEKARELVEADVCDYMAQDLVRDEKGPEYGWQEDGEWEELVEKEIGLGLEELEKFWANKERWKMSDSYELVWNEESDTTTVAFHVLEPTGKRAISIPPK